METLPSIIIKVPKKKLKCSDAINEQDFLDMLGYASRAAKTAKDLANQLNYYSDTMESFLERMRERFKESEGVQQQSRRLPRHQIYS